MISNHKQEAEIQYNIGTLIIANLPNSPSVKMYLEEAATHLQKATELDPEFAFAHHNLALVWYSIGEYYAATTDGLQEIFNEIFSEFNSATNDAQNTVPVEQWAQFRESARKLNPLDAEESRISALNRALDAVNRAISVQQYFPQAHNTRAIILAKLFRLDEALTEVKVAIAQNLDYENAINNKVKIEELIMQRYSQGFDNDDEFRKKVTQAIKEQAAIWERQWK